jgi:antirestriction protein ArdC/phage/plasmid primase-like uncharacterized protein
MTVPENNDNITRVSDMLVQQLGRNAAPWQQSWRGGSPFMPMNPVSGKPYRGINAVSLATEAIDRAYHDNRWLTADQATKLGGTVKQGEIGSVVQYWQFSFTDGDQTVKLEKPRTFNCVVYNAQQIDGLPELERSVVPIHLRTQQVGNIVRGSRAAFAMDANGGPATYDRERDLILLVRRDEQDNIGRRHIDVVHQLAHWTGPRLGRDIDHPVGSIGAAREELRTNLASLMLGDRLRIGWNPGNHAAYAKPWAELLTKDPTELLRASLSAESITLHVLGLERARSTPELSAQQMQELASKTIDRDRTATPDLPAAANDGIHLLRQPIDVKTIVAQAMGQQATPERETIEIKAPTMIEADHPSLRTSDDRTYLAVPYSEKDDARALGAQWDRKERAWYVPAGQDLGPFEAWLPAKGRVYIAPEVDPRVEFKTALEQAGLIIEGLPAMDGKIHRVPVTDSKRGNKDGAYIGHLDGRPAGNIQNFITGHKANWKSTGAVSALSADQKAALAAEAAQHRVDRARERAREYERAAQQANAIWAAATPCEAHPYLDKKNAQAHGLRLAGAGTMLEVGDEEDKRQIDIGGRLLIPVHKDGELRSLQVIDDRGFKMFLRGGEIAGGHYLIGDPNSPWPLHVVEGYATGATIHANTGHTVAVAFNAYNLAAVAQAYRDANKERSIFITGDNDHGKEHETDAQGRPKRNVGRDSALAAAEQVGGYAILPKFGDDERKLSDWNDLAAARGNDEVQRQLTAGMAIGRRHELAREREAGRESPQRGRSLERAGIER